MPGVDASDAITTAEKIALERVSMTFPTASPASSTNANYPPCRYIEARRSAWTLELPKSRASENTAAPFAIVKATSTPMTSRHSATTTDKSSDIPTAVLQRGLVGHRHHSPHL